MEANGFRDELYNSNNIDKARKVFAKLVEFNPSQQNALVDLLKLVGSDKANKALPPYDLDKPYDPTQPRDYSRPYDPSKPYDPTNPNDPRTPPPAKL